MADKTIIGIDIGGTNFRIGAVSADNTVSSFYKIPVGQVFHTADPLDDLVNYLLDYSRGMLVKAAAIGFPATLDRERQTVLQAPNIPFMERLPVVQRLTQALGFPVFIERDVTMAMHYDLARYQLPNRGIIVGIYFGTGIGNAIFIDGVPLTGKNGVAGELGHIPADGSGLPCGCGNTGCIENLAGGKYLARLCREVYPGTPIGRLFAEHGGEPLMRQFVDRMSMAVATEINILDPDYVLIGGGVPNMDGFPRKLLLERVLFHTRTPSPAQNLEIIFTGDGEAKCVIGAARYANVNCQSNSRGGAAAT